MHLFLTSVLPFLAHDHPGAAAFLTCRHHNFHASIIPEFLSDEKRVKAFCEAQQENQLEADKEKQYKNSYNLFVQTPLMQFSPSLIVFHKDCVESILKPLLETKYFARTLQRCSVVSCRVPVTIELAQALSKVQSLTKFDSGWREVGNEHLEILVNFCPSLETLNVENARQLKTVDPNTAMKFISPPPPATKTLRNLTLDHVEGLFASQFVPHFPNLRHLVLVGKNSFMDMDLLPLSSSLHLLTDLHLENFDLKNTDSIKNLVYLSSLEFRSCEISDLIFLKQENSLPYLTTLLFKNCDRLSTSSFAHLSHAPNLLVLEIESGGFNDSCWQYLENMVHLRKLQLSSNRIVGVSRSLQQTLMQQLSKLQELSLSGCYIGGHRAIAGALYSTHRSRLSVLNLSHCHLVDDDLNGIDALKNTLEVLDLSGNWGLSKEGLTHCTDLVNLKKLRLCNCGGINDLSPLKDCLNLEDLLSYDSLRLTDASFQVFSEEPNSFPNLRMLCVSSNTHQLTEKIFEHLAKNNHLVHQLKELYVGDMGKILSSSATARENLCQLRGLRRLEGIGYGLSESDRKKLKGELMGSLKNLEVG